MLNYNKQIEQTRKLIAMGDLARTISSHLVREHILTDTLEGVKKLFSCTKCSILLFEEDQHALR